MPDAVDLDLYEVAYVCGGPARVAMVALVGLCEDGHIKIAPARHRVTVLHRDHRDSVQAAALELIPDTGRLLGSVLAAVAESEAVGEIAEGLRARGLLARSRRKGRWPSSQRDQGRDMRRRLENASPPEPGDPRRVAVLGSPGIIDPALRRVFETPDPDLSTTPIRTGKVTDTNDGYRTPNRSHGYDGGTHTGW